MKLVRLKSLANNAVRELIRSPEGILLDPFLAWKPTQVIVIDLLKGLLSPDMEGDSVEQYYKAMSKWFHSALQKEGIPLEVIESATLTITPEGKKCIIKAQGRTFESSI